MLATSSPVTASIIRSRSIISAFFLAAGADAERIEHRQRVGRDMEADADLAELARLLQHQRAEALPRQRQRAGKPADAAARDGDGLRVAC